MRFDTTLLSLTSLALALAGCGILPGVGDERGPRSAAQSERGAFAVQRYEDAKNLLAQAADGALSPEIAQQGQTAATQCESAAETLIDTDRYPETEELTTSDGVITVATLRERCQAMLSQFRRQNLREPPVAVVQDPALEAGALEVIRRNATSRGWDEDFRTVRIISPDWSINRHPATGVILSRWRTVAAGAVWPDGHCTFQEMSMVQAYDGRGYASEMTLGGVESQVQVSCDHVTAGQ